MRERERDTEGMEAERQLVSVVLYMGRTSTKNKIDTVKLPPVRRKGEERGKSKRRRKKKKKKNKVKKMELYMFNCCSEETSHVRNKPREN